MSLEKVEKRSLDSGSLGKAMYDPEELGAKIAAEIMRATAPLKKAIEAIAHEVGNLKEPPRPPNIEKALRESPAGAILRQIQEDLAALARPSTVRPAAAPPKRDSRDDERHALAKALSTAPPGAQDEIRKLITRAG